MYFLSFSSFDSRKSASRSRAGGRVIEFTKRGGVTRARVIFRSRRGAGILFPGWKLRDKEKGLSVRGGRRKWERKRKRDGGGRERAEEAMRRERGGERRSEKQREGEERLRRKVERKEEGRNCVLRNVCKSTVVLWVSHTHKPVVGSRFSLSLSLSFNVRYLSLHAWTRATVHTSARGHARVRVVSIGLAAF